MLIPLGKPITIERDAAGNLIDVTVPGELIIKIRDQQGHIIAIGVIRFAPQTAPAQQQNEFDFHRWWLYRQGIPII